MAVHSPGFVADTDQEAADLLWPHSKAMHDRIGRERGWPPMTRAQFDGRDRARLAVRRLARDGRRARSPRTVKTLGVQRFDLKYTNGTIPHEQLMRNLELYGAKVIPRVRELLAEGE